MKTNEYLDLLKTWCDTLIDLQYKDESDPKLYGSLRCPACNDIHGRCADAMYPMMVLYRHTGDAKYLNAAKRLFCWVETNVRCPDGSYMNDPKNNWKGITVFAALQLGECLMRHGDLLDRETYDTWKNRIKECIDFLDTWMETEERNINYSIAYATVLALSAKMFGNEAHKNKSYELAHYWMKYILEDGMLYGEGHPIDLVTPKGAHFVDLGYNVEESFCNLVLYMMFSGDDSILPELVRAMRAHLEFMLPDGGWDNSWGCRSAKWSYWGGRTSDGCQLAYGYLGKDYPEFAEAAHRNFELYRKCTHNGLLYGGPMYYQAGEPACVHHTFCHAKALAFMVDLDFKKPTPSVKLPRETADGIAFYPTPRVWLMAKGDWRATMADSDIDPLYAFSSAMTMLWHHKAGPLVAASLRDFVRLEGINMQVAKVPPICQTPRLQAEGDGVLYMNLNDYSSQISTADGDVLEFNAKGVLRDKKQNGSDTYELSYQIGAEELQIRAVTDAVNAKFMLPLISSSDQTYELEKDRAVIHGEGYEVILESDGALSVTPIETDRVFDPVGGFQTIPFEISMEAGREVCIRLRCRAI